MIRETVKNIARQIRPARGPGQLYFRAPGGPAYRIEDREMIEPLDFAAIDRTDGPLKQLYFKSSGNGEFTVIEIGLIVDLGGRPIDPKDRDLPSPRNDRDYQEFMHSFKHFSYGPGGHDSEIRPEFYRGRRQ